MGCLIGKNSNMDIPIKNLIKILNNTYAASAREKPGGFV
jgi:hypothetical protein